jgi:hypothetical protein
MQKYRNLFINFKLLFIMKALNVFAYGVEEMNKQEIISMDGGYYLPEGFEFPTSFDGRYDKPEWELTTEEWLINKFGVGRILF